MFANAGIAKMNWFISSFDFENTSNLIWVLFLLLPPQTELLAKYINKSLLQVYLLAKYINKSLLQVSTYRHCLNSRVIQFV